MIAPENRLDLPDSVYSTRNHEYDLSDDVSVVNRLNKNSLFWKEELKVSPFIQSVVDNGYIIPFKSIPPPFYAKNNKSSLDNSKFAEKAIEDLLQKGAIREVFEKPYCTNPLTVSEKNSKLRLVLDLRHVNKFVKHVKFKYEDLRTLSEMFSEDDYFTTFDLKYGYHHISIHPEHYKYLGFQWSFATKVRFFEFVVLPFGLSEASFIFTKVLRPFVTRWRSMGFKSIIFIDDGINGQSGYKKAAEACSVILSDLKRAGFIVNLPKCQLIPLKVGKWLGVIINTHDMTFTVPKEKIEKLVLAIQGVLKQKYVSAKQLAKIAGRLSSMHMSIGPLVWLFTRNMYFQIESRQSWHDAYELFDKTKDELNFWLENIEKSNVFSFKPKPVTAKVVFTDASEEGYGGFVFNRLSEEICKGRFTFDECGSSSTSRELLAIKYVLSSFGKILTGQAIQINTDSLNASRILSIGSSKTHLQEIAVDIFKYCMINDIKLIPQWIPRSLNTIADEISKSVDTDNWSIDRYSFNKIQERFGIFTFDRFADDLNTKTKQFNSKHFCLQSYGVNAFTFDWSRENNWICPPVSLIGSCIRHMRICKCEGTLVVPVWKSAYFWPIIYPNGFQMPHFIKDIFVFNPVYTSPVEGSVFNGKAVFNCMALKIVF